MSKTDWTGGPAFPGEVALLNQGMTLREYFAAKAMQGILASCGNHDVTSFVEIASDAYKMADAMLGERAKSRT